MLVYVEIAKTVCADPDDRIKTFVRTLSKHQDGAPADPWNLNYSRFVLLSARIAILLHELQSSSGKEKPRWILLLRKTTTELFVYILPHITSPSWCTPIYQSSQWMLCSHKMMGNTNIAIRSSQVRL